MNSRFPVLAAILTLVLSSAGCQSQGERKIDTEVKTASSLKMVPRKDLRTLRTTLPGQSMREVIRILGQPTEVFTIDGRESWRYDNAVRDSVTDQPVPYLEIVFLKRKVVTVNFSY